MHHTDEVIDFAECDLGDAEIELLRAREDLGQVKVGQILNCKPSQILLFHSKPIRVT